MAEAETETDQGMTLGDHLDELRKRLFRGVIAVLVCFVVSWIYRGPAYDIFLGPFRHSVTMLNEDWREEIELRLEVDSSIDRLEYYMTDDPADMRLRPEFVVPDDPLMTAPGEHFMTELKVSLYFALFVGGPYLLWQLWGFIGAGLYKSERRVVLSFFPASILLFFSGVLFGYYTLVPFGMYYLSTDLRPGNGLISFKLDTYFTFISSLCLALGVVFQLPIVQTALAKVGLVEARSFARFRGHFALCAFVIAAILTPPDPITQSLMAGPMVLLYEVGIIAARIVESKSTDLVEAA